MSELLNKLQWRYACKKMDPTKVVPQDKVDRIVEAARLAPGFGLDLLAHSRVGDHKNFKRLQAAGSGGQAQVTDGSHLLVFAAWDNYTAERINMMFDLTNAERGGTNEGWENYRQMLLKNYPARTPEVNYEHAARQAYIGLGAALIAAAFEEVDATPMEGFDPKAVDEILGLSARGLRSVVIVPLGYRASEGDWLANLKKVRRPTAQFVTEVK